MVAYYSLSLQTIKRLKDGTRVLKPVLIKESKLKTSKLIVCGALGFLIGAFVGPFSLPLAVLMGVAISALVWNA